MGTLFHLVRHGSYGLIDRALGGRADHSLAPEGREQAARVATALGAWRASAIVSSPVRRAIETAESIASRLNLPLHLDPALAEIDFAGWTGVPFATLHGDPEWQSWNHFRSTAGVPGGETMLAVQVRAIAALIRHATTAPNGEMVVVSHADVIKSVLTHLLGAPLDLMRRMEIAPGSISRVWLGRNDARVIAVNLQP